MDKWGYNGSIKYIQSKQPHWNEQGVKVYDHAQEVIRSYSCYLWEKANKDLKKKGVNKKNCQVFVVAPAHRTDVTTEFYLNQTEIQAGNDNFLKIGKNIVASNFGNHWDDKEPDYRIKDAVPGVQSVYIVGSPQNEQDYFLLASIAHDLEDVYGVKTVTYVLTNVGMSRGDKNVATGTSEYDNKVRSIATVMKILSGDENHKHRIIGIEAHSGTAHAEAAKNKIIMAPISPWKYLVDEINKISPFNIQETVVVRPDEGRNLAAQRIDQYLKVPWVPFVKHKIEGTDTATFDLVHPKDREKLRGKEIFLYDDEGASLKTIYNLAKDLKKYDIKKLKLCLVHAKLTKGWEEKLMRIIEELQIPIEVFITDSRDQIGNVEEFNKAYPGTIKKIGLTPFLQEIIKADLEDVNFWEDERYKKMIIQGMVGEKAK